MGWNIFSPIFASKKARKKVLKTVLKTAAKAVPIVKTVSVGHSILKVGKVAYNVSEVAGNLNDFIPRASKLADSIDQFIPSMQVMGQSLCDSIKVFNYFNMIATSVGIGANLVLTYQGIQVLQLIETRLKEISTSLAAQTALIAQKDFPQYVYDMIRERLGQTSDDLDRDHWFFLYHPDNDWYPKFYHFLEDKPLGRRFCGYTNQIDTVFVFMKAVRQRIKEKERRAREQGRPIRPVKLHLLIPAYQPILIVEALKIPEEIGDFIMEGRINSNREFVWLNLPEEQRHFVVDIGHWVPPTLGWWDWAMSNLGLVEKPPVLREPRVLGTRQESPEDDEEEGEEDSESSNGADDDDADDDGNGNFGDHDNGGHSREDERNRHQSTPLHHRHRRHHRRHRRNRGEDRESRRGSESTSSHPHSGHRTGRRSRTPSSPLRS